MVLQAPVESPAQLRPGAGYLPTAVGVALTVVGAGLVGMLAAWNPLVAVLLSGLVAVMWLVLNRDVALALMVLGMPLMRSVFGMVGYFFFCLPVAALTVLVLKSFIRRRAVEVPVEHGPLLLLGLFGMYALVSFWFRAFAAQGSVVPNPLEVEGPTFFQWIVPTILCFCAVGCLVKRRRQLKLVVCCLAASAVALAIVGLLQRSISYDFVGSVYGRFWHVDPYAAGSYNLGRISSLFYDSNYMANSLVVSALISFPFLLSLAKSYSGRLLVAVASGVVAWAAYLSYSAGNWIGFGVGLTSIWVLMPGKAKLRVASAVAAAVLLFVLLAAYGVLDAPALPEAMQAKISAIESIPGGMNALERGAFSDRAAMIRYGMGVFHQSAVFGVGMGGLRTLLEYPHNSYVLMLAEFGVVGTVLFLLFVASVVGVGLSNIRRNEDRQLRYLQIGTLASIFASLVWLFTYDCIMYALPLWFAMGLTIAIGAVLRGERHGKI